MLEDGGEILDEKLPEITPSEILERQLGPR